MKHHKSQQRKTYTVCAGLRGTASFIGGLVGEETLKVVIVYTLCSDVEVRYHIGFMSSVCVTESVFSSFLCIFRDLLCSHWLILCKRYILKVQFYESSLREKSDYLFPFFLLSTVLLGSQRLHWLAGGKSQNGLSAAEQWELPESEKAAKTVWKMTQVKRQQNCRPAQCTGWLVYSPQASDSPQRNSAAHSAESNAADWTD